MFTSKQELIVYKGVDPEIAAFFVDRAVPKNNAYWKGRYLYVTRGNGFLFIPLFFDLQLRAGVDRKVLLDEGYVQLMESIMDLAGKYELGEIDFEKHIQAIDELVSKRSVQISLLENLRVYFSKNPPVQIGNIGTNNTALNRGDVFLYLLTVLPVCEETINKIIDYWYLLIPSFLMMDDIMDLQDDIEKQEENSLTFFGYDAIGIKKALLFLNDNLSKLEEINPTLGRNLKEVVDEKIETTYFKHILNE